MCIGHLCVSLSFDADMVLLILLIFTLLLKVQPQRLSDQVWLTASPASVQKDSNTALRYDRPTDADHSHYNTVLNQSKMFNLVQTGMLFGTCLGKITVTDAVFKECQSV
ncbi:hypothetical protein PO909_020248 [Leuciscus waleckii]